MNAPIKSEILINDMPNVATLKTIYERRAIRKYQDRQIDDDLIEAILDAGRMAPSAMNKQELRFYILTHRDNILAFSREIVKIASGILAKDALKHPLAIIKTLLHFRNERPHFEGEDPIFHGAPVVIFITAPSESEWADIDTGMCAQNMMLAATSLGLDSCPIGLARYAAETPVLHKLGISGDEKIELALGLGYGAESGTAHARITNNAIFVDRVECV